MSHQLDTGSHDAVAMLETFGVFRPVMVPFSGFLQCGHSSLCTLIKPWDSDVAVLHITWKGTVTMINRTVKSNG